VKRKPADKRTLQVIGWSLASMAILVSCVAAFLVVTETDSAAESQFASVDRFWPDRGHELTR